MWSKVVLQTVSGEHHLRIRTGSGGGREQQYALNYEIQTDPNELKTQVKPKGNINNVKNIDAIEWVNIMEPHTRVNLIIDYCFECVLKLYLSIGTNLRGPASRRELQLLDVSLDGGVHHRELQSTDHLRIPSMESKYFYAR
ncbi:hypothetical protein RUM43_006292 [Polyplax serrata]|uniref:Uncharacterized protein n=1 Tax=Polyplax serrata TaxID=468196 RepID=A0AAN8RVA2_POLSC